jgi:hypothetical protein
MSSNSPNDDARRTSPRKSAGQMQPQYLARETNEQKGGKGAKKLGVGLKKRTAAMKQSESPSSYDDDSDSLPSVQPRKKSRGTTVGRMSGGTRSHGVSRGAKVAKGKKSSTGASAAKGKKTPEYRSDDFSSSGDDSDSTQNSRTGKHSVKDLLEKIREKEEMIMSLNLKLSNSKINSRMNKTKVREELKWTGEETNFAETVNHFCRFYLFPRFKFLKNGWTEIMPDKNNSFYSLCMRHLKIPEGADKKDIWERVIVPSVMRKYLNMKCNLNNDIKSVYMSMPICLCESTFTVILNYTDIYFIICRLINAGERTRVWPDELGKGFQDYVKLKLEHVVYDFMCTYVRRIKPDTKWKKILKMNAGNPFICHFTPSDIAYVLAIIKNGQEMWDQAKNPSTSPEKKLKPLYSSGEGRKRESGISMWNKEGLAFYYTVEKNWKEIYNDKEQFSVLMNGWEIWEPKDKSKKDAVRTYWSLEEEEISSEKNVPQEKDWWEKEEGYDTDSKVNTEFLWEEKTKQIIKDRMGVGDEDSDDDSDDGEGSKVGEGKIVDEQEDDEDEDDNDNKKKDDNNNEEVHLKRRSDRRKQI